MNSTQKNEVSIMSLNTWQAPQVQEIEIAGGGPVLTVEDATYDS